MKPVKPYFSNSRNVIFVIFVSSGVAVERAKLQIDVSNFAHHVPLQRVNAKYFCAKPRGIKSDTFSKAWGLRRDQPLMSGHRVKVLESSLWDTYLCCVCFCVYGLIRRKLLLIAFEGWSRYATCSSYMNRCNLDMQGAKLQCSLAFLNNFLPREWKQSMITTAGAIEAI